MPGLTLPQGSGLFSHAAFDRVLRRFVDEQGRVAYAALQRESQDIERYYALLTTYSPDSHPELFPSTASQLAYWLNAYNAAVIKTVLAHYPITGVGDVQSPLALFFLPAKSGFFVLQRVTFGGKTTNLYFLEHRVIRQRFHDPRVHFALNCASGGCPRLPRYAFAAEQLDEQLDFEARKFVTEERNVFVDHSHRTVRLSSIFDWYSEDFLTWYGKQFPRQEATMLRYIALYASPSQVEDLKQADSYTIEFLPYDWRLNDQNETRFVFSSGGRSLGSLCVAVNSGIDNGLSEKFG